MNTFVTGKKINMKKLIFLLLLTNLLLGCSDDGFNNNNPFIPNIRFSANINIDLPSFSDLNFGGNSIYVPPQIGGVRGLIIFNSGSGFFAYDAACPNQAITSCSTLVTNGGINAVCPCDDESYNLFTGLSTLEYPLKRYRVEVNLPIIRVYN